MRFISAISAYKLVVIHEDVEILASGQPRVIAPGFTAEFRQGGLLPHEKEVAARELKFRNQTYYKDGTPVDLIPRVSLFDTSEIHDPKLRERVEKAMLANPDFGKQDGYMLVEAPKVTAPWASYDELTIHGQRTAEKVAERNIEIARTTGTSLEALIAYERQNRNDARIIAAYEAAQAEAQAEEPASELVEA